VLVVDLKDGRKLEEPLARPTNLVEPEDIEQKFRDCVADVLSREQATAIIQTVHKLEHLPSARELTRNLRADTDIVHVRKAGMKP
jgi:hypothetical protein